ncbi:MAG: tetratricopeptide repeat protein [Pseudomonadota bacterium]
MADVFSEVEDELREERMKALWKRYGVFAGAAALLVIGGVAGWNWRADAQVAAAAAAAEAFAAADIAALSDSDLGREAFLSVAAGDHPAYTALARIRAARLQADAGDLAGAAAAFAAAADDADAPEPLRALANLGAAETATAAGDPDAALERLDGLTAIGSPWRASALELAAGAHLAKGDADAARMALRDAADDLTLGPAERARAATLLDVIE